MADLHARAGRYGDAGKNYQALLLQQPQDVSALNNLANIQLKLGDKTALQTAEKAHGLAPANALVIDTLGWAHHHFGQQDRALSLLRDARLREPANPEIRYHLAKVLAQTGRQGEAQEELREAMKTGRPFEGSREAEQLLKTLN
ncbi:putative PEP-CTERM system TPR-repeat lipoprotein [compost metagenome]